MTLTEKQLAELKEDLLMMKKRLENRTNAEETHDINTDDVSFTDNHLADSATEYVDRQTHIAEDHLHDEQLNKVNEALDRMEEGAYGICVDTGEEIPFERLKAIPYAKRTVQAKENLQKQSPANKSEDPTRLVKPKGEIED